MDANKGVRKRVGMAAAVAALAVLGTLPTAASGDVVGDVVTGLGLDKALGGSGGEQGAGQTSGSTTPHAQGTVAQVDISAPEGADGDGALLDDGGLLDSEEVVVGRSSAQQNSDGSYEGGVTLLGLFGHVILGIDTDTAETVAARFQPVKDLLDGVCTGSDNTICLTLLASESSTDGSGSSSSFGIATADIGRGEHGISAGVGESSAALRDDGQCQTAAAGSTIARADILGQLQATLLDSSTGSVACRGAGSQSGDSTVFEINGHGLPLPGNCSGGVNSGFGVLSLVEVSCNSEQGSGGAGAAGGSNEAVGVEALGGDAIAGTPLAGATSGALPGVESGAAATESGAAAPAGSTGGPGTGSDPGTGSAGEPGSGDSGGPGDPGDDTTLVANPVGDDPTPLEDGKLAFTGLSLPMLLGIGLAMVAAGLLATSGRRRLT